MQYFSLSTNVNQLRIGNDSTKNIGNEIGKFVVSTMEIPWEITKGKLGQSPEKVINVTSVELSWIENQINDLPDFDTIVGIGGGMAIDVAKYISWKLDKRLVSIPTILSVDAFTTPAAGIRNNHDVQYLGTATPDPLIIDYNILRTAPKELNIAGIGDLFSIHTASFDWTYANSKGKSEYPSWEDQLDTIYHSGVDAWKEDIKAIKDKYPKQTMDPNELLNRKKVAVFEMQKRNYKVAAARLAEYELSEGVKDENGHYVIEPLPLYVEGVGRNPLIVQDEAERRAAQRVIDNSPQAVIDSVSS